MPGLDERAKALIHKVNSCESSNIELKLATRQANDWLIDWLFCSTDEADWLNGGMLVLLNR